MSREIKRVNDLRECTGNGLDVNKQREDPITRNPLGIDTTVLIRIGPYCYNIDSLKAHFNYYRRHDLERRGIPYEQAYWAEWVNDVEPVRNIDNTPFTRKELKHLYNYL